MLIMRGLLGANYSLFEEGWQSPDELLLIDVFYCDTGHLWGEKSMNKEEDHGKLKEKKVMVTNNKNSESQKYIFFNALNVS